jgi:hypothetical protein
MFSMDADMASISSGNAMHDTESNIDDTPLLNQEASMFDLMQNISNAAANPAGKHPPQPYRYQQREFR